MDEIAKTGLHKLFEEVRRAVAFLQPDLECHILDSSVVVEGTYHLLASSPETAAQGPLASYDIKIIFDQSYPIAEPRLYETGGVIPHESDYHVNSDGDCCYGIWELLVAQTPGMSVQQFLDGPVRSFFFSQHYHAITGLWPFDELPHGDRGLLEAYSKFLACPPDREIIEVLLRLLSQKWRRDRHRCLCGSGKRLRDCCRARLNAIPTKPHYRQARRLLSRLQKYPKQQRRVVKGPRSATNVSSGARKSQKVVTTSC